jgi:PKD repeat protein
VIATGEANDGTYAWTVPNFNSSNCLVRTTAVDLAGNSASDVSNAVFTITSDNTPPAVMVYSPNGGESMAGGSTYTITWSATDNLTPGANLLIDLAYSINGSTTWTSIVSDTANDGAFSWTIPSVDSTQCLVRVSTEDSAGNPAFDTSNTVFSISTPEVMFDLPSFTIVKGANCEVDIVLDSAPNGLSGYQITVALSVAAQGIADIVDWDFAAWAAYTSETLTADSVAIRAADTGNAVGAGAANVVLGTLTLTGVAEGAAGTDDITITITQLDDDSGTAMTATAGTADIEVVVALAPVSGGTGNPPTDPDGDGVYEDVDGNGSLGFNDVVLFFNQMDWIDLNEPVSCFDFNGNGRIDFADVVTLFDMV